MHSVLVHDYYSRLDPNAVFVIVDTSLKSGRLNIKAHIRLVWWKPVTKHLPSPFILCPQTHSIRVPIRMQ